MSRMPNTITKAERQEIHRAKMAGKKFDRDRRFEDNRQRQIRVLKAQLASILERNAEAPAEGERDKVAAVAAEMELPDLPAFFDGADA